MIRPKYEKKFRVYRLCDGKEYSIATAEIYVDNLARYPLSFGTPAYVCSNNINLNLTEISGNFETKS